MRVVVDAGVAVKWDLEEDHAAPARRLLDATADAAVTTPDEKDRHSPCDRRRTA